MRPGSTSRRLRERSRCSRSPTATSGSATTSTRASRSACPAPTSTRFDELRPLPLRRGRLRLPGVGPDARQRHERQDHPPARRRRAVRHPVRRAALPRARPRLPRRRPPPRGRVDLAGRAQALRLRTTRARCRSSSGRRPRSSSRSSRCTARFASSRSPSSSRTSPAPARLAGPARRRCRSSSPLSAEEHFHLDARVVLVHSTQRSGLRLAARAWTTWSRAPPGTDDLVGELTRRGTRC